MKDPFFIFHLYDPNNDLSDHHMENPQTDSALLNIPFFAICRNKKEKLPCSILKISSKSAALLLYETMFLIF